MYFSFFLNTRQTSTKKIDTEKKISETCNIFLKFSCKTLNSTKKKKKKFQNGHLGQHNVMFV